MMTSKGIRRKKSSLTEVKVALIGAPGVGKSALVVRFLTKRYIGEYDHQADTTYKHEVLIDNEPILYELLDSCPKKKTELLPPDVTDWADGLLAIYSITDRRSFHYIKHALSLMTDDIPVYIVANKSDIVHLREVSVEEGASLAKELECGFSEVAAAEQVAPIAVVFQEICRAVLVGRRKSKSLLDRMLGTKTPNLRLYVRGKSDSALPKD